MDTNLFKVKENSIKSMYEHFNRTKEDVDKDIEIILEWLKTQPHLPEIMCKLFLEKKN